MKSYARENEKQYNLCGQVVKKVEGSTEAERADVVETSKPKKAIARAGCWKGSLLKSLQGKGETILI